MSIATAEGSGFEYYVLKFYRLSMQPCTVILALAGDKAAVLQQEGFFCSVPE